MNVFLLSSISDATLMLDFCEVQHLKLNLSEALVARRNERNTLPPFFNLRSKYVLLSCGYIAKKKNGNNFLT